MNPRDVVVEHVPQCLRDLAQWVGWKYVERDGKQTKCPVNAKGGGLADSTDPATWATFDEALAAYRSDSLAGVGFVFTRGGGFSGVDLDSCLDPETGAPKPWAEEIIRRLNSYTEVSPSGRGVKVFLRASKPGSRCRKAYEDGEVEVYDAGRFFTVTGRRLGGTSAEVEERQTELQEVYAEVFGDEEAPKPAAPPTDRVPRLGDEAILKKAFRSRKSGEKFQTLWNGQWNGYFNSPSEADSSVVFTLAFYTKDPAQIDRLFRQSRLFRPKWDEYHGEQTYGELTIAKALQKVTGQYRPRRRKKKRAGLAPPEAPVPTTASGLPTIIVGDIQLADLTAQGLQAVRRANAPPVVFVRSGSLCRVVPNLDGLPAIEVFDKVRMRCRLADVAQFFSVSADGAYVGVNPPLYLAENILAQGMWDFPPLVGIARSPILRRDGTLCTTPGYDGESRLYYFSDSGLVVPPIPENPSPEDLKAAVDLLLDLVAEFPFADAASRAGALAILFSVLMRPVIDGHIPMAIVDAPVQGTGKSLLVSALGIVGVGTVSGESIPSRQNEDEWRKKITALLLAAPPFVLLDNIPDNSIIDSASLAAMLTTYEWSDRLLGKNEHVRLPARSVWVATGNNLRVSGDIPRRCYTVRMDANMERPWERTGFHHEDLERYARESRGSLLAAAFTVIRCWYAAGSLKAEVRPFGSFQEWADTVGSVLAYAGVEGFLDNLDQTRTIQDEDTEQWRAFFAAWWGAFGTRAVTSDDLCTRILARNTIPDEALPDALLVNRDKGEGSLKRSLGRNLARLAGRIFDGRKVRSAGTNTHMKVRTWQLEARNGPSEGSVTPLTPHNPHVTPQDKSSADKDLEQNAGLAGLFCIAPAHAGACARARDHERPENNPPNPDNPAAGPEGEELIL